MKTFVLISVICLQLGWSHVSGKPGGVGAYAYQDTAGNRYGGTYGLDDAQVYNSQGKGFIPPMIPNLQMFNFVDFFPEYFSNLENLLQETFKKNLENQKRAYDAARKAFDLTSNDAGYIPNFTSRLNNFGRFGMPNNYNGAYAGGFAAPGYTHQIAAVSPENPMQPNINIVNRFSDTDDPSGKFYSVSSSSYATSSNVNGLEDSHRGSETVVNNNGEITKYQVGS